MHHLFAKSTHWVYICEKKERVLEHLGWYQNQHWKGFRVFTCLKYWPLACSNSATQNFEYLKTPKSSKSLSNWNCYIWSRLVSIRNRYDNVGFEHAACSNVPSFQYFRQYLRCTTDARWTWHWNWWTLTRSKIHILKFL